MGDLFKYRIYCETDSKHEFTDWQSGAPTECPVNAGHTITASKTARVDRKPVESVVYDPVMEPVVPDATKVVANDRPAIEIQNGATGFATIQAVWPLESSSDAKVKATLQFILKAAGTGTKVRLAFRTKADALGGDTSGAFDVSDFSAVTVTHTTVGELFSGAIELDASSFGEGDALALQIGRDGNNEMGAGDDDDVNVAIQIVAVKIEGY